MKRREFITLVGGVAAWATAGRAQQRLQRIAIVHPSNPIAALGTSGDLQHWRAFFRELERLGFSEGKNLLVERYSGEGQIDHYEELAKQVVSRAPDLIVTASAGMIRHFRSATETIPIVGVTSDPVAFGLTPSLPRPEGNITGVVTDAGFEIWQKRIALLKEAVPSVGRIGFLATRAVVEGPIRRLIEEAAQRTGVVLIMGALESPVNQSEYSRVFAVLLQDRVQAIVIGPGPENFTYWRSIVGLVAKNRLPAIYSYRDFPEGGGLMAYAVDLVDLHIRAAGQVVQILKGAKVSEIAFYQATTFKLVINLKTAKALGLTIPPSLLARADELIE
jgi:ABC-type uncharacterized transport system substrate-binding protein